MYKGYVDDINIIVEIPDDAPTVTSINSNSLGSESKIDTRIMDLIKETGKNIHPSIQPEADYPSNQCDQMIPILEVKVWVD